ncbi:MAG: TonB-dependent receptor [Bacteroidales bacterium]|nr:TonB-dependent receptor [Bacteroidales bacterium]
MMKRLIVFMSVFLIMSIIKAQGPEKLISCHVDKVSFSQFSDWLNKESGVQVFYLPSWVSPIKVTVHQDQISVIDAVKLAIRGTGLEVSAWNGHLVLLKGEKLITELPVYNNDGQASDTLTEQAKELTASEERYLTGRKADVVQSIRVGKVGGNNGNSKAKVLGRVLDVETGEPVFYATIYFPELKSGAVSDINGFFSVMLKPGKYTVLFEFLGYEKKKYLLDVISDGELSIQLKKAVIQMKEFVVYGDRQMNIKAKDAGLDKISMKSIKELPMMMGERDILKVSEMLPGIVSAGEGSAGLNVRGGSSDQNAFYINKIPIYNTSHLFGFFPAFNSDIIKDFSIYKGHIPAQYGGRLSSVFNIVTRQGNRKHFTAHGGISPITGNIVVEGPLKKDTCTLLISARSSYSDWILKKIKNPDIRAGSAGFYDFSAAVNYDIQKTQLSLFVYHSSDRFKMPDINNFNYANSGMAMSFSHNYSNALRGEFAVIGSQYSFNTINMQEKSSAYEHGYLMGHYEAKADFKHMIGGNNALMYGAGTVLYQLDRGNVEPFGSQSLHNRVLLGKEQGLESAIYLADSYDPSPRLNITLGLRYTIFNPMGPGTVFTYQPDSPRELRYVSDTLIYGKNNIINWYHEPDIRASVNFETDENGTLKLAFNQMHQNLFMLNNAISIAPNAQWKLADYHLKPSASNQFSFGIFRTLARSGLETSVEVYYKTTTDYPDFKDGADFLESSHVETQVLQGTQKAYGVEFFLRRSNTKLEGWLSYTLSRSMVHISGENAWDKINYGESFPANYDIPHALNLVLNYHLSRRVTFSSIVAYQSGKPITYPVSVYYIDGVPQLDFSKRNAYRIPDYFRTDVSLTVEGSLKKHKLMHSSLIISVYNLTGRQNPYSVYFTNENGKIRGYQYSVIGVPIMTATWIFKLGNYASE